MKKVLLTASKASHFKNFHIPYVKYLLENGCKVYTAAEGSFQPAPEGVVQIGLPFRKKLFSPKNIGVILKLARLIRKEGFDLVCTNSTLAGAAGRMALILSGSKKTSSCHICHGYLFNDDGGKRAKAYLFIEKLLKKRTDLLAVMNKDDLEIAEKYALGNETVFINGMGLDTDAFPEISPEIIAETRKSLGANENTLLFLCAAEFSERKNQKTVIKALSEADRQDCKVIFAGDGELLNECKALAAELNADGRTVFLGHYEKMNILYRSCDCLISAGRFEGLPFNVMEALYCGENIIVSDVKGNRDLAEASAAVSRLFPYESPEALAQLIKDAKKPLSRGCKLPEKYFLKNVLKENLELLRMSNLRR